MKYHDKVYGDFEITEPVIIDLINSNPIQRLKYIDQAGYLEPFIPGSSRSRFDHSLGVYLLLKKFGATIEEQISGLIHDVSHSAFSHCIDYVLESGSEKDHNHQDNIFDLFVRKSELPEIIKKYGYDFEYILDDKNFPLKERDLPDLCADRIDYSLRDSTVFKEIDNADYFIDNLIIKDNSWIFNDVSSAKKYAELFLYINAKYYSGLESAVMFLTIGEYLKYSIQKKYISVDDLYTTDKQVLDKIEPHIKIDPHLSLLFDRLNNKISYNNNPKDYDGKVFCKSRIVDPLCVHGKDIKRLSDIVPDWHNLVKNESKPKEYFIKFDR